MLRFEKIVLNTKFKVRTHTDGCCNCSQVCFKVNEIIKLLLFKKYFSILIFVNFDTKLLKFKKVLQNVIDLAWILNYDKVYFLLILLVIGLLCTVKLSSYRQLNYYWLLLCKAAISPQSFTNVKYYYVIIFFLNAV